MRKTSYPRESMPCPCGCGVTTGLYAGSEITYKRYATETCRKRLHDRRRKRTAHPYDKCKDKILARNGVWAAVKEGRLKKPDKCEFCGAIGKVDGHHTSYEKAQRLSVRWLCRDCHRRIHAA